MARGGLRPGAGRKVGSADKVNWDVRLAAREYTPAAMAELGRLSTKAESERVRVAATEVLFDRAYGRAPQAVYIEGNLAIAEIDETVIVQRIAHLLTGGMKLIEG